MWVEFRSTASPHSTHCKARGTARTCAMPMNAHAAARLRAKKRARSSTTAELANGTASSARASAAAATPVASALPKAKRMRTAAPKDLGWKSIVLPAELGFDDDGGLLELDEVDGVDVVYGEDGRIAFQVRVCVCVCCLIYGVSSMCLRWSPARAVAKVTEINIGRSGRMRQVQRRRRWPRTPRRAAGRARTGQLTTQRKTTGSP